MRTQRDSFRYAATISRAGSLVFGFLLASGLAVGAALALPDVDGPPAELQEQLNETPAVPAAVKAEAHVAEAAPETEATAASPAEAEGQSKPIWIRPRQLDVAGRRVGPARLQGTIELGLRTVDVGGRKTKYREDIDLENGARLLNTRLIITPEQRTPGRWFDRATIIADGVGGDPYETWGVSLYRSQTYRFDVRSRTVDYFWAVTGEPHQWNLTREMVDARLSMTPVDGLEVFGMFNRFSQDGVLGTTRDISRNEFHFDQPIDQDGSSWSVGARYTFDRTVLFFDQEVRQFNDNSGYSSGFNTGFAPDEAFLTFLEAREVRAVDVPVTRGGVNTWLADGRVNVMADVLYSNQTLGFSWGRQWDGENFQNRPVSVSENAFGETEREILHGNVAVVVKAHDIVNVVGRYRRRGWDQEGGSFADEFTLFTEEDTFTRARGLSDSGYEIFHNQFLVGGELLPAPGVTLFAEVGFTQRDQVFAYETTSGFPEGGEREEDIVTDTTAFRLGGTYRPSSLWDVTVAYDRGNVDDPFTRISPTEANRFKIRARTRPRDGVTVGGHYTYRDVTNTVSEHELTFKGFGLFASYTRPDGTAFANVSYDRQDVDSETPIRFVFPFFGNFVDGLAVYETADNVFIAAAEYQLSESVPLAIYGSLSYIDSSGTVTLEFVDGIIGGRYTFSNGFYLDVQGRFIDYQEDTELPSSLDDYDAKIFTVGVGFRF